MSAPVVLRGLTPVRYAAATKWSAPVTPGGFSEDCDHMPLVISTCLRKGSSGSYTKGNLNPGALLSGIQYPGATPCGMNAPTKRVGYGCLSAPRAGIIDSRNGRDSVVPNPRKNVRRGNGRLVRNTMLTLLHAPPGMRCSCPSAAAHPLRSACRHWQRSCG